MSLSFGGFLPTNYIISRFYYVVSKTLIKSLKKLIFIYLKNISFL
jgi:hypothetical protein